MLSRRSRCLVSFVGAIGALLGACSDNIALAPLDDAATTSDAGAAGDDAALPDVGMADAPPPDAAPVDPSPWKGGARLRAKVKNGGDGAKLFEHWEDTILRFGCSFALATDGRLRCLPVAEDTNAITTIFSDPDCTQSIALGPAPENPYVRIVEARCGRADDSAQRTRVVRWGSTISVPQPYIMRSGVCSQIVNAPSTIWYKIGEVEPRALAAADERLHTAPDGLQLRVLEVDDGAREHAGFVDPATVRPCDVLSDHVLGAPDLCVPVPFAVAPALPFFDGPACSQAIALTENACDGAQAGVMLRRTGCGHAFDLVALGESFSTDSRELFRRGHDGVCRSDGVNEKMKAYAAGMPFPEATFTKIAKTSLGTGRLRALLSATSDGLVARNVRILPLGYQLNPNDPLARVQPFPLEFFDTVSGATCRVEKVADASLRCVPAKTEPKLGQYFEDEVCTRPVHLGSIDPMCPSTGFVSMPGWLEIGLGLRPTAEIRPIGAMLPTIPYMYAPDPGSDPTAPPRGTCIRDIARPGHYYFALGTPVPVAELPLITDLVE